MALGSALELERRRTEEQGGIAVELLGEDRGIDRELDLGLTVDLREQRPGDLVVDTLEVLTRPDRAGRCPGERLV